jgi:putative addiction module component (TIGR02574 family)
MARQPAFGQTPASSLELDEQELSGEAEIDGGPVLTDAQRNELQRRLDEYDRNPDDVVEWEDLRQELLERVARRGPARAWARSFLMACSLPAMQNGHSKRFQLV